MANGHNDSSSRLKHERIDLRVTYEEKLAWLAEAEHEGMKLAEWIRNIVNADMSMRPSPEQRAKNLAEWEKNAIPIGSTVTLKLPPRYKLRYFDVE